ncbi:carbohydrate ABC transporter permease [Georgenia alba]|uniref:Carbohydrate ABC transporter permease n=1 Tax=Georgenia alba TaxID=2233858 RepID=A0ABW2QFY8_9MICO
MTPVGARSSAGRKVFVAVNTTYLLAIVAVTLYPFLNVVAQSFSSEAAINAGTVNLVPRGFNVETYRFVMADAMFWINYKNTVVYTVVATAISLTLTTMFAYAVSRRYLPGRQFFIGVAVFTMFFSGGIIPNYVLISTLGMKDTIWSVVIPGAINVFNLLVMKTFFENLPTELEEAAMIDGLGHFRTLLSIVLPLSKAIVATMLLFYAVAHWNSWFPAFLYLSDREAFPITVYLRNLIAGAANTGTGAGGASGLVSIASNIKAVTMFLTVLPILFVYPFIQKHFVSGVMLGAVKG